MNAMEHAEARKMNRSKVRLLSLAAGILVPLAGIAFLFGGTGVSPTASTQTAAPTGAATPVKTRLASIPVEGMFCLSCAATVKRKVKSLDGVQNAEVHFREKIVVVNYRADRPDVPDRAVAAINSLGYKARPAIGN